MDHNNNMPPQPDPRRIVGGSCWAKSTAVSNDSRRIYGVDAAKIWLRGTVLEVLTSRTEGAQRASTYIKAKFTVGNTEKVKVILISQLKKDNPVLPDAPQVAPQETVATAPGENGADISPSTTTGAAPVAATAPATEGTEESGRSSVRLPTVTVHNRQWFEGDTELPTNGPFTRRTWKLTCQYSGRDLTPGCDLLRELKPFDFFMAVFPSSQLKLMVEETSANLAAKGHPQTTRGEVLKFFGVLLLITRFEFGDRRDLWSTRSSSKYIPAAAFGEKTGMSRDRFELILQQLVWSRQPAERPEGMSHEAYRWMLVEDFVANFNEHRQQYFCPSWHMCADESISQWYGLGGHWINIGLPMYVAMDRKPEDGMEIQNVCCAISGVMCQLKLVKTAAANAEEAQYVCHCRMSLVVAFLTSTAL